MIWLGQTMGNYFLLRSYFKFRSIKGIYYSNVLALRYSVRVLFIYLFLNRQYDVFCIF